MGVYLSSPITEKESIDEQCSEFSYGASSMQGWRITQEDAHNCIPEFDPQTKTSFFAVYDGHGGSEVAKYCERYFPDFFKELMESHGDKNDPEKVIKSAFLAFDATLTQEEVVKELKELSGKDDNDEEEEEDHPVGRTETDMLKEEATMPLNELLEKYEISKPEDGEGSSKEPDCAGSSKDADCASQGSSKEPDCAVKSLKKTAKQTFQSPALRAKGASRTGSRSDLENGSEAAASEPPQNTSSTNISSTSISSSSSTSTQESNSNHLHNGLDNTNANKTMSSEVIQDDTNAHTNNNVDKSNGPAVSDSSNSAASSKGYLSEHNIEISSTANSSNSSVSYKVSSKHNLDSSSNIDVGCSGSSSTEISSTANSSSMDVDGSGSSKAVSSNHNMDEGGSGSSSKPVPQVDDSVPVSSSNERTSKIKAAAVMALDDGILDSSDDEDEEDQEEAWDASGSSEDDDDDEEEDEENENDENSPMMDMSNEEPGSDSGCTACVVLMQEKRVVVANAGDSRCVLARAGKAVELSFDHKPEDDSERERIETAGGKVTADGRVNGGLNLSRAIGDHVYKRNKELPAKAQMITALPDIETAELTDEDQFIVIACDGIWNYMSSQEVVDYVLEKLKDPEKRKKPSIVCEELFDHCLAPNTYGDGTGCDNMTCIIVVLKTFKCEDSSPSEANTEVTTTDVHLLKDFKHPEPDSSGDSCSQPAADPDVQSSSGTLKRCADDVDTNEKTEKRLKLEEEVA